MRKYRTIQGDTWDKIAYRLYQDYGAENLMSILLDYNPDYVDYAIFPAGIMLDVPNITAPVVENLPPWKRA